MARLVLHVGTHKTATTTLQNTLFANRRRLAKHGIIYPLTCMGRAHHNLAGDCSRLPTRYRLPKSPAGVWADLGARYGGTDKTVILSSEEFSRGPPKSPVDFRQLRTFAKSFEEVQVLCVLRDQLSFLQSVYLQISTRHRSPGWKHFFKKALRNKYSSGVFLDYNLLYDHFLSGFSSPEIRLVPFERIKQHPKGIVGLFLEELGAEAAIGTLKNVRDHNVSSDPLAYWIASRIAAPKGVSSPLVEFAAYLIAQEFGADCSTTFYSKSEIKQLRTRFEPLNARLSTRVQGFSENMLPMEMPGNKIIYRDDLTDEFWNRAAQALYYQRRSKFSSWKSPQARSFRGE